MNETITTAHCRNCDYVIALVRTVLGAQPVWYHEVDGSQWCADGEHEAEPRA